MRPPPNGSETPGLGWRTATILLVCLCFLAGCSREAGRGVQLILSTQELGPGTTFEVRFDEPMATGQVGAQALVSPLVFKPGVAGHFVWTSPRSGVFTPDEALALDTEYVVSLRSDLRLADSRPVSAMLRRLLRTPPFGVVESQNSGTRLDDAYSSPDFWLWFNADVKASAVGTRAGFVNAEGKWVPAVARQGTREDYRGMAQTWQQLFDDQRREHVRPRSQPNPSEDPTTNEIANLVVVSPAQPLTAGHNWRLMVASKVPSADGRWRSNAKFEATVGNIVDFTLNEVSMHNIVGRTPFLDLDFSKYLDPALTNSFTNWVRISPWPDGVAATVGSRQLRLTGGWQRRTNYIVTVRRGLPANEPFALETPFTFTNEVPPVDPRLYFPEFSTEQLAGGNRLFPLLAVNVGRVQVQAKLLDAPVAIHALRGYSSYYGGKDHAYGESEGYHRLDYNLVPGRTIFSTNFDAGRQEDVAEEIKLDWDRLLGGRKAGIVFLQAEEAKPDDDKTPALGTQALIQLTDLGLAWKTSAGRLQAFVFSYATGQPATNATVRLYSNENELLAEAPTDSSGVAALTTGTNLFPQNASNRPKALWLAAQAGEDLHAVSLDGNDIPTWWFNVPRRWRNEPDETTRRVALFTDRDAYRPNESVNVKAIVRDLLEAGLSIPAGRTGLVECADSRERPFFRTNFTLSGLGSCATIIPLPASPRGSYQVRLKLDGQDYLKQIQVADFQPAAFEIELKPKAAYGPDEKIELPVSAHYFFGKPLSRAQVSWSVEGNDHPLQPDGFEGFVFERTWSDSRRHAPSGNFSLQGKGRIEGGSNCLLQVEVPLNPEAPQPRTVTVLAEVTDLNEQTLTHSAEFVKHSSDFYLGLKQPERVLEPGKPLPLEVAVVGADGQPWRDSVTAHVTVQRVTWDTVLIQGTGRRARYRSEASLTNVVEKDVVVAPPVKLETGEKGFRGSVLEGLVPPTNGEYVVEVTARDAAGHAVASSLEFTVSGKADLAWDYRSGVDLKLVPDKPVYQAGESALVLVKAPFSGEAWVTVEREKVLRSFLARLEGNTPAIRVPIEATDVPNVFVSITLVRGAADSPHQVKEPEYRVGCCQLSVENPANRLQVEVTPDTTNCLPGHTVTVTASVRNTAGSPAVGAEATLYAVDEGVLSLTDYTAPDLLATMLITRALDVNSGISLPLLMSEDPERLSFHNKGYLGGGGGNEPGERVRRRFLPCAYWNASLLTDAEGRVTASFAAPDSVTRYRIIAVVHNALSQFGTGKSAFTVSKPLILEPALPQFANITDRLQARALVQNQTDQDGAVLVTLQLDDKAQVSTNLVGAHDSNRARSRPNGETGTIGIVRSGGQSNACILTQTISIPAHGSAVAEFPLVLGATGQAKWTWRARFADGSTLDPRPSALTPLTFSDAVQSSLPISEVTPLLREVVTVRLEGGETNLLAAVNPQLLTGAGTIAVTVANTRMVALREAIQQLLHYPYGCVEQTSSSLLPWVVLHDTPALLDLTRQDGVEAAAAAKAGIERLFSMQTSSGGLSYWPGEHEPMFWGSAYGALVLERARMAGLAVPEKEFDSLLAYLSRQLRAPGTRNTDAYAQCLALYVLALAGKAEPAYHTQFAEQREHLGSEERALLALAMITGETNSLAGGDASAPGSSAALVKELLLPKTPARRGVLDPFGCDAREKAVRLLAWMAWPAGEKQAETVYHDLEMDQKHGHWSTTQGNGWALLAMRDYLRKTEAGTGARSGVLTWGGQKKEFQLETGCGLFSDTFAFDSSMSDRPLVLANPSGKSLYAQVAIESRLPNLNSARQDHGFAVQRRYERLNDNNEPEHFDRLRVGDRVLVTLRVSVPEPAQYVAIDDPLPGVFEAVNSEFKTQQVAGKVQHALWMAQDEGDYWWSSFQEIRADRVLFFGDDVHAGRYVIRYVARVRAAGTVTAPAAKAEEMYHPERFGLTETQPIISEASD